MLVKNYFSATAKVAMAVVALFGMAACANVSENKETAQQVPMTEVEQAQAAPQIQRTAFLPTENTPDFVDAAEASVNAVVHIKTTIIRKSATYNDFFGAFLEHLYGIPGQMQNNTMVAYGSGAEVLYREARAAQSRREASMDSEEHEGQPWQRRLLPVRRQR